MVEKIYEFLILLLTKRIKDEFANRHLAVIDIIISVIEIITDHANQNHENLNKKSIFYFLNKF